MLFVYLLYMAALYYGMYSSPELSSQTVVTNNDAISSLSLDVEEALSSLNIRISVGICLGLLTLMDLAYIIII